MAGKKPDEVLTIGVELESRRALQAMNRLEQEMKGELKSVSKAIANFGRLNQDVLKDVVDSTKEYIGELDDLELAHNRQYKQLDRIADQIEALQKKQEKASESAKKDIEEQINLLKKQSATMSSRVAMKIVTTASANKTRKDMADMFDKVADDAGGIFSSFFSKDLKGLIEGGGKGAGKLLGFGLKKAAGAAMRGGSRLSEAGSGMAAKGAAKGGMGGTAMQGIGKALQGLGGIMGKMGPLLNTVSKLGPMLGVAASAVMAIVKLFIDAEAQAKQFQKDILQSASTTEFLAAAGGNVNVAFEDIKSTLKDIRDSAYSLDNLNWGITAEEHKQVFNVLNQEGVSLVRIREEAQAAKKTMGDFAGELVHTSVAYSRAFGVPLQEINQMQAEMMTDLGMSLESTRLAFAQMTRSASESGIASNKFFAIIRGVSADLSLYNTRMEDAVKTLKLLGKVMNPREAQKFMQTATQGLKNMGRQERLRMTLLAGTGKMGKLVERDFKAKQKSIADQIGATGTTSAEDAAKILQSGSKAAINDMVNKLPKEMQGAIREGVIDLDLQKTRARKGTFGTSGAAANLGPAGALEAFRSALKGWGGGKSLAEGAGSIGMEMMADNLGISQEQLDHMIKFEAAMDMERETLKSLFAKQASGQSLTADEQARLQKAQGEGIKSATDVDKAGYDQIYSTMDEASKKAQSDATKVESLGQKQSRLTKSLLDQLNVLIDFIMNQLYNSLVGIWEGVLSTIPEALRTQGVQDSIDLVSNIKAARKFGGSQEVVQAVSEGGDVKGKLANTAGMKAFDQLAKDWLNREKTTPLDDLRKEDLEEPRDALGRAVPWGSPNAVSPSEADQKELAALKAKIAKDSQLSAAMTQVTKSLGIERAQGESDSDLLARIQEAFKNADTLTSIAATTTAEKQAGTLGYLNPDKDKGAGGKAPDPEIAKKTQESSATTAAATQDLADAGTSPNTLYTKFSNTFLRGNYKRTMEEIMLDSLRQALFEFYMYSQMDPAEVAKFLGEKGMTAKSFAETVGKEAEEGRTPKDLTGLDYVEADKNAAGGLVTGVSGGLAMVRAAAGEGLASIGPGERILPAGGAGRGGDQFNINVNGIGGNDLARFLQVKVADGIVEYKRRERFA